MLRGPGLSLSLSLSLGLAAWAWIRINAAESSRGRPPTRGTVTCTSDRNVGDAASDGERADDSCGDPQAEWVRERAGGAGRAAFKVLTLGIKEPGMRKTNGKHRRFTVIYYGTKD